MSLKWGKLTECRLQHHVHGFRAVKEGGKSKIKKIREKKIAE